MGRLVTWRVGILVGGAALLLDQLSKDLAATLLAGAPAAEFGPFVLRYATNPGAAMGMLGELPAVVRLPLLLLLTAGALGVLLPYVARRVPTGPVRQAAVALVLAGAVGNLFDRLRSGQVIDFVALQLTSMEAGAHAGPFFNLADVAVTVGAAMLLVMILRRRRTVLEAVALSTTLSGGSP